MMGRDGEVWRFGPSWVPRQADTRNVRVNPLSLSLRENALAVGSLTPAMAARAQAYLFLAAGVVGSLGCCSPIPTLRPRQPAAIQGASFARGRSRCVLGAADAGLAHHQGTLRRHASLTSLAHRLHRDGAPARTSSSTSGSPSTRSISCPPPRPLLLCPVRRPQLRRRGLGARGCSAYTASGADAPTRTSRRSS